jgi:hypothetical protein
MMTRRMLVYGVVVVIAGLAISVAVLAMQAGKLSTQKSSLAVEKVALVAENERNLGEIREARERAEAAEKTARTALTKAKARARAILARERGKLRVREAALNELAADLDAREQELESPVASAPASVDSAGANCHPSYEGECLDQSLYDYDCGGGSGDGPGYVIGTVTVVGPDDYGLDADGDGYGCD